MERKYGVSAISFSLYSEQETTDTPYSVQFKGAMWVKSKYLHLLSVNPQCVLCKAKQHVNTILLTEFWWLWNREYSQGH